MIPLLILASLWVVLIVALAIGAYAARMQERIGFGVITEVDESTTDVKVRGA